MEVDQHASGGPSSHPSEQQSGSSTTPQEDPPPNSPILNVLSSHAFSQSDDAHHGWDPSSIAMAKCDMCSLAARGVIYKCSQCKLSICRPCCEAGRLDNDSRHELDAGSVSWEPLPKEKKSRSTARGRGSRGGWASRGRASRGRSWREGDDHHGRGNLTSLSRDIHGVTNPTMGSAVATTPDTGVNHRERGNAIPAAKENETAQSRYAHQNVSRGTVYYEPSSQSPRSTMAATALAGMHYLTAPQETSPCDYNHHSPPSRPTYTSPRQHMAPMSLIRQPSLQESADQRHPHTSSPYPSLRPRRTPEPRNNERPYIDTSRYRSRSPPQDRYIPQRETNWPYHHHSERPHLQRPMNEYSTERAPVAEHMSNHQHQRSLSSTYQSPFAARATFLRAEEPTRLPPISSLFPTHHSPTAASASTRAPGPAPPPAPAPPSASASRQAPNCSHTEHSKYYSSQMNNQPHKCPFVGQMKNYLLEAVSRKLPPCSSLRDPWKQFNPRLREELIDIWTETNRLMDALPRADVSLEERRRLLLQAGREALASRRLTLEPGMPDVVGEWIDKMEGRFCEEYGVTYEGEGYEERDSHR